MDTPHAAAVVLAALELVPGEPWDLSALLRDPAQRVELLGPDANQTERGGLDRPSGYTRRPRQLIEYLGRTLDYGRVEHWAKVVEKGAAEHNYTAHIIGSADYPNLLAEVYDAPPILFARGRHRSAPHGPGLEALPSLAIIGSRRTSTEVLDNVVEVARAAAGAGVCIVSGLAAGVDAAAHRGALEVGGATTAVMGTGIETVYPRANARLAEEIAEMGVLLSQFAPPTPSTGTTFLRRNCVIAALSQASLIMDGQQRSGSRHEIEQAIRYQRPVLMWRPALANQPWARELERVGAATFVDSPAQVIAAVPDSGRAD